MAETIEGTVFKGELAAIPESLRQAPVNFYWLCWAPLRAHNANIINVFGTAEALARLCPHWTVDMRFTHYHTTLENELDILGIKLRPNFKIDTLQPEFASKKRYKLFDDLFAFDRVANVPSELRDSYLNYWKKLLAMPNSVFYTRNMGILSFMDPHIPPEVPRIYELHQLRYHLRAKAFTEPPKTLERLKKRMRLEIDRERDSMARADMVFSISKALMDRTSRMLPKTPSRMLRCSFPAETTPPPSARERDIDLIYTGQLYSWKGIDFIFEILRHVKSPAKLLIIGGNNASDVAICKTIARNLGVADRIEWLGQMPHHQVTAYQKRAKVGVVPLPNTHRISRLYTSPVKVFEYANRGIALIVSDVPAMRDVLGRAQAAEFAPQNDPRAWARLIDELLADPDRRDRLTQGARTLLAKESYEHRAERIRLGVLECLMARQAGVAAR